MTYLRLIILSFGVSACSGLRPFPTDRVWEWDPKSDVCGEYKIVDAKNLKVVHVRDVPRAQCPAIFGFTAKAIPKVLDWSADAIKKCADKCK